MVSDKAITYTGGAPLQSDTNIKKVRRIGKFQWHALIAGYPTFALRVIDVVERILAEQAKKQPKEQNSLHHTVLMSVFKTAAGLSAIRQLPVLYSQLVDYSVSASARNLLEQSLILHGPLAEQCDGFGELVAGWREAVVNMRRDNWMNQSVEQSAFLQLP
jgi:hypothetical protein